MLISLQQFRGIRPYIDPELLPNEEAQAAENVRVRRGLIRPWDQILWKSDLVHQGLIKTIMLYESSHWFEWDADVDVVLAPLSGDTAGKLYFTGDGIPKKTNRDLATTGAGAKPISFYPLALPSPKHAATAALGAGGSGDARDVNYVWTLVSNWSEESWPSPASNTVAAKQGQTVDLSGMTHESQASTAYSLGECVIPTTPNGSLYKCVVAGTSAGTEPTWGTTIDGDTTDNTVTWRCFPDNMSYKRIYRLNVGTEFAQYQFVDQIAASQKTYSDSKTDTELAEALGTADYAPPPDSLLGLIYMGNGIMAGFVGKDVYFSEPWQFHAWPVGYIISLPYNVIGLGVVPGALIAVTDGEPYIFSGVDPSAISHDPIPEAPACMSKRSIVSAVLDTPQGSRGQVLYACPFGVYIIDGAAGTLLTKDRLDKKSFAAYMPATMHGVVYDNYYFGFYSYGSDEGCLVVDLLTGDVTTLSLYADAAYVDRQTDQLYYVTGMNEVILLENGSPSRINALLQEDGSYILRE